MFYLVEMFRTPSPGDSISVALRNGSKEVGEGVSCCKEVCNKGGRQSEHHRLLLRKTSHQVKECGTLLCYFRFHVWEDARVWDY